MQPSNGEESDALFKAYGMGGECRDAVGLRTQLCRGGVRTRLLRPRPLRPSGGRDLRLLTRLLRRLALQLPALEPRGPLRVPRTLLPQSFPRRSSAPGVPQPLRILPAAPRPGLEPRRSAVRFAAEADGAGLSAGAAQALG